MLRSIGKQSGVSMFACCSWYSRRNTQRRWIKTGTQVTLLVSTVTCHWLVIDMFCVMSTHTASTATSQCLLTRVRSVRPSLALTPRYVRSRPEFWHYWYFYYLYTVLALVLLLLLVFVFANCSQFYWRYFGAKPFLSVLWHCWFGVSKTTQCI